MGRFSQLDPSRGEANLFVYVQGNPINRVDPSGQQSPSPCLPHDLACQLVSWLVAIGPTAPPTQAPFGTQLPEPPPFVLDGTGPGLSALGGVTAGLTTSEALCALGLATAFEFLIMSDAEYYYGIATAHTYENFHTGNWVSAELQRLRDRLDQAQRVRTRPRGSGDVFERIGSESEALQAHQTRQLSFERPGNLTEKWIMLIGVAGSRPRFGGDSHYTYRMIIYTWPGTLALIEAVAVDEEDTSRFGGPYPIEQVWVLTKQNEPGRYGLRPLFLPEFNRRIDRIDIARIR